MCRRVLDAVPVSDQGLRECILAKHCHIFDYRSNSGGHATTDYRSWLRQDSKSLRRIPCFTSDRYEPYLVLPKLPTTPAYDERFVGYVKRARPRRMLYSAATAATTTTSD